MVSTVPNNEVSKKRGIMPEEERARMQQQLQEADESADELEEKEDEEQKQDEDALDENEEDDESNEQSEDENEEDDSKEVEEKKPSRREQLRIQQLLAKMKQGNRSEPTKEDGPLNYRDAIDAPDEVYEQLEKNDQRIRTDAYDSGVKRAESIKFYTRLEIDAPKVESKYPIFDKESPDFDEQVAGAINAWYLSSVGYNPKTDTVDNSDMRYYDFVEGIFELAGVISEKKTSETKKNIVKQVAKTGIRPTGTAPKMDLTKSPQDMTNEELDAFLSKNIKK